MNYGIVGNGFVGKATHMILPKEHVVVYDIQPELCNPIGVSLEQIASCDVVFICVPTPSMSSGRCDTSIVKSVIDDLRKVNETLTIVVRSTVPVGFCNSMGVSFFPEFLTERNWEQDVLNTTKWTVGIHPIHAPHLQQIFHLLSSSPYKCLIDVAFVTTNEAEMLKYARNTFLALKVGFANELASMCRRLDIPWDTMSYLIGDDRRIGRSHLSVPGPDGHFGFGGTCFPKDCLSLQTQMMDFNVKSLILDALIKRNNEIDRV